MLKKLSKRDRVFVVGLLTIAVIASILAVIFARRANISAVVMRLIRLEGEVTLYDASGQNVSILEDMKLHSGNSLKTGSDGLVDLSLDDTKFLTIENTSNVEFEKKGKALSLHLTEGRLFFNVTQKLADDESMEISTSNMVVGIRGTSGYVDADVHDIYVGDGVVHLTATDKRTGKKVEIDIYAGQKAHVRESTSEEDPATFEVENFTVQDIPKQMLRNIVMNPDLFTRVVDATGYSPKELIKEAIIKEILPEDMVLDEEKEEILEEILKEMKEPEEEDKQEDESGDDTVTADDVTTPTTNNTTGQTDEKTEETEETQESTPATPAATPTSYTITVNAATGGSASASASSATAGTAITLTATPDAAYAFSGWTVNEGGVTITDEASTTFTMPEGNVSVTANFTKRTEFNVTASCAAGMGTVWMEAGDANMTTSDDGSSVIATVNPEIESYISVGATPAQGYLFDRWTGVSGIEDGQDTDMSITFAMPEADVNATATFTRNYQIKVNYSSDQCTITNADNSTVIQPGETVSVAQYGSLTVFAEGKSIDASSGYVVNTGSFVTSNDDMCSVTSNQDGSYTITPSGESANFTVDVEPGVGG